jgi:hypothetical protein
LAEVSLCVPLTTKLGSGQNAKRVGRQLQRLYRRAAHFKLKTGLPLRKIQYYIDSYFFIDPIEISLKNTVLP